MSLKNLGMRQGIFPHEDETRLFTTFSCPKHGVFEENVIISHYVKSKSGNSAYSYKLSCMFCVQDFLEGKIKSNEIEYWEYIDPWTDQDKERLAKSNYNPKVQRQISEEIKKRVYDKKNQ